MCDDEILVAYLIFKDYQRYFLDKTIRNFFIISWVRYKWHVIDLLDKRDQLSCKDNNVKSIFSIIRLITSYLIRSNFLSSLFNT